MYGGQWGHYKNDQRLIFFSTVLSKLISYIKQFITQSIFLVKFFFSCKFFAFSIIKVMEVLFKFMQVIFQEGKKINLQSLFLCLTSTLYNSRARTGGYTIHIKDSNLIFY